MRHVFCLSFVLLANNAIAQEKLKIEPEAMFKLAAGKAKTPPPATVGKGGFANQPTAEQLAFFEKKIRPVLADNCYSCHASTGDKIRGGLVLDSREGIRQGGDSGPAIIPGDPK